MNLFLLAVIILFLLAIFDLYAGVANDAVNFINSAVGAKVATRKTIMIVASIGVVVGAMFSSGMMEIAKSGVFNPASLTFEDIMIVFLAVLIADVILLDAFNTFGMPTSTTVSLVFELLGASVVVALWKILGKSQSISELANYINTAKALAMITAILTSVWISLSVAIVVQYLSRLIFSFSYEKRFQWIGGIWCGLSFASMNYFLLIKGLKGASFIPSSVTTYVAEHGAYSFMYLFILGAILAQSLIFAKVNVLRILVLYGTACLAAAFAGNDLVNFIGPSVAAMDAYSAWAESGVPADQLTMEALGKKVATQPFILLIAGVIMVVTLWISKKARTVTETEVGLARQDAGLERFKPNALARFLIFAGRRLGSIISFIIPAKLLDAMESNFQRPPANPSEDAPAFDLIRATVNLTTASSLIAIGTALKLPLSTTYVTFLVAMGTSLSDRAWGRETAVYRVAGVLNVIGGWFLTAFVAFICSAFFATVIYFTGAFGVVVSLLLAGYAIYHSFRIHALREKQFSQEKQLEREKEEDESDVAAQGYREAVRILREIRRTYIGTIQGFVSENSSSLKTLRSQLKDLEFATEQKRMVLLHRVAHSDADQLMPNRRILKVFDLSHDILLSLRDLVKRCSNHVLNSHLPPNDFQAKMLNDLITLMDDYLETAANFMDGSKEISAETFRDHKLSTYAQIERLIENHVGSQDNGGTRRNNESISRILMEAKDLVAISARLLKHFDKRVRVRQRSEQGDLAEQPAKS